MQTVWLEFRHENGAIAANGTDTTFYIDGRWNWNTTLTKIWKRLDELRSGPFAVKYSRQWFIGITYQGGREGAIHTLSDPNPPMWARPCICDSSHESCACPQHPTCQGEHLDEDGNALGNRFNRL